MKGEYTVKKTLIMALCIAMLLLVCVSAQAATVTPTGTGVTVIKAADWAETYPDVYASYQKNAENEAVFDHVEEYPMIATVYEDNNRGTHFRPATASSRSPNPPTQWLPAQKEP